MTSHAPLSFRILTRCLRQAALVLGLALAVLPSVVLAAAPTVTAGTANLASNATTLTITGTDFDAATPGNNTVVFTPAGTGTVTASTATSLTVTGLSGLTPGALNAVVTSNGESSGSAVQVAMVFALPAVSANLVAQWVADDWAGGTNDWVDRIGGKIATVPGASNSPTKSATGLDGATALVFDGVDDYLRVNAEQNPIVGKNSVTIVAYFNTTRGASGTDIAFWRYPGPLNGESPAGPNDWGLTYNAAGEARGFFNDEIQPSTAVSLIDGQPHTMILTWKDVSDFPGEGVARLYVDGELIGSTGPNDGGDGIYNNGFVIGSEPEELLRYFSGAIRELRFYDDVIDPVAIDEDLVPLRTLPATSLTDTTGTLNGRANPQGVDMTGWFEYGTDPALAGATSTTVLIIGNGASPVSFYVPLVGLSGNTRYYFRAVTEAGGVTAFGSILTFVTGPDIAVEQPAGTNLTDGVSTANIGSVAVGVASAAKTFTIKNAGGLDLTDIDVVIDGAFAGEYVVSAPADTTLAPGASTTFSITFTPGGAGSRPAALHIASNDSDENPFDLALDGTGLPARIWTGGRIIFSKDSFSDWTQEENQDRLTPGVWLTRMIDQGLFNIALESNPDFTSPADTEWAYGTTADLGSLTFGPVEDPNGFSPPVMLNQDAVLHLISENIYIDINFSYWEEDFGGGFSYSRSTPGGGEISSPTSASITAVSAVLGGNVINDGGDAIIERGVVFSASATNSDPFIGGMGVTKVTASGTFGVFTAAVSLDPSTAYSYKAYATNSSGTTYTPVATFATLSNDATLSSLALSGGTLSPTFAGDTTTYTARVPNGTTSITVTPTVTQASATVTVNTVTVASGSPSDAISLSVGSNAITTVVTAEDGTTTATYTVNVTRDAAADYIVTTTGNAISITDSSGNADTLGVSEPSAGNISFAATGRTFSVDGGLISSDTSATISRTSVTSITVDAGAGADTINVGAFTGTLPSLSLNGGTGNDTVNLNGSLTFAANANLDLDLQNDNATPGIDSVNVAGSAVVAASGTGTITVRVSQSVALTTGAQLNTVNGALTIEANIAGTNTNTFDGVTVNGATIQATGSGNVTVVGQGGNGGGTAPSGVVLLNAGKIIGGTSGTVSVTGTGGTGSSTNSGPLSLVGVKVMNTNSRITSTGANVQVTGFGGTATGSATFGILVYNSAAITAGGTGSVTVSGTGGSCSGGFNNGVLVSSNSSVITSTNGPVQVTGIGGTGGATNYGIDLQLSGTITAGGTNSVTMTGTGGSGSGGGHVGVYVKSVSGSGDSQVKSSGGNITVTGTAGTGGSGNLGVQVLPFGAMTTAASGGNITVIADSMDLSSIVSTNAGGTVALRQKTNAVAINLGSAVDTTASTVELSDGELDYVTAGTVVIGDVNSGTITTVAAITHLNNLSLITGAGLTASQPVTMAVDKSLTFSGVGAVSVSAAISASGTGAISLTTAQNVAVTSTISTVNGNLTVSANQQGVATSGTFVGVDVNNGLVRATGTGVVSVLGKGGDVGDSQIGVRVQGGGDIIGGTSGTLTVTGAGGASTGASNAGINVNGSGSTITSLGSHVQVTGTGGGGTYSMGIDLYNSPQITSTGAGNLTIIGNGGLNPASGAFNHGIIMGSAIFSTAGGNTSVTGNGGSGSNSSGDFTGIQMDDSTISAGGTGTVTVNATGGAAATSQTTIGLDVRFTSQITSSGGNVSVTSTGGNTSNNSTGAGAGMRLIGNGTITAGGAGTVSATGTGGGGSSAGHEGIVINGSGLNSNLARIGAANGATTLTATSGNSASYALVVGSSNAGSITTGSNNPITIYADSINFGGSAIVSSGTATTAIIPSTAGTFINLGGADVLSGSPRTLGLTDSELDYVTAGTLVLGDANSGLTTITAVISPASYTTLDIQKALTFSATGGFDADFVSGTVFEKLKANGAVTITAGATLTATATGGYVPAVGGTFTVLDNISASTTTGAFSGKAEGSTVSIGGLSNSLSYVGGTGNDVVFTTLSIIDSPSGSPVTYSGVISGSSGLTKTGTDVLTLTGLNTYTGPTHIKEGTLSINTVNTGVNPQALGEGGVVNLGVANTSSGTLLYTGGAGTLDKTINALGNGSDTIQNGGSGLLTLSGTLNKAGTVLTLKGGTNGITVSGVIAGNTGSPNSDLVVDGGVVTLTNANTYNGPTYIRNSGTLNANAIDALPTLNGRTDLTFDGTGTSVLSLGTAQSIASLTSAGAATVTLNANTLTIGAASGSTSFAGTIGGTGGITKDGASTQILTGANLYTGATSITAGTLQVDGSLASGSTVGVGTAGTLSGSGTINGNATLIGSGIVNLTNPGTIAGTLGVTGGNWNGAGSVTGLVTASSGTFTIGSGANLTANGDLSVTGGTLASGSATSTITGSVSYTSGSNSTFAGVIAGSGKTLTLNNAAATLTLSGTNTYTGATTISAGTLQLGAGGTTGSLSTSSAITNNGTLTFNRSNATTQGTDFASAIGGSGAVVQAGSGTLVLNGTNTYTGLTTVSTGVLNIQNASALGTTAAGTSVTSGAALQIQGSITTAAEALTLNGTGVSADGALRSISGTNTYAGLVTLGSASRINSDAGTLTLSNTGTITGSGLALTVGGAGNTTINSIIGTGSGTLTKDGAGVLTLTGANTYTGATTVSGGTLEVGGSGSISGDAASFNAFTVAGGGTLTFSSSGTSTFYADGYNNAAQIGNGATGTVNIQAGTVNISSKTGGAASAGSIQLGTNSATAVGLLNVSGGTLNVAGRILMGANNSSSNATLTISGGAVNLGVAGSYTVAGDPANGVLWLAAGKSIVNLDGGTLAMYGIASGSTSTNAAAGSAFNFNGGTLKAVGNSGTAFLNLNSNVAVVVKSGGAIVDDGGFAVGISRALQHDSTLGATLDGGLTKLGIGTLTLSGTNTYTGATTITAGTLQVTGSLAAGSTVGVGTAGTLSGSGTINGNATVTGSGIINLTNPGTIAGTLGVTGGNWNGAGSVTGLVTSSSGTFTIGSGANLTANGDLSVTGGTIASGNSSSTITGNVSYTSGSSSTFGGVIAGSGKTLSLNNAAATLTLSGTNTYTGATTVTTGNLQVTGSLAAGSTVGVGTAGTLSGSGTINGNATVTGGGIISLTNPGIIAGTLGVTGGNWNGAGSVTGLVTSSSGVFTIGSGANLTANGGLSVTGGTLASGSGTSTITGSVSYTSASSSTFGGVIAGSSKTLTLNNAAATLTLSGTNTYTGATTVSAGILNIQNATGLGSTAAGTTVSNGATLQIQGGITVGAEALSLNGGAASGQTGALVNVSGTNTYGGAITVTSSSSISAASGSVLNLTGGVIKNGTTLTLNGGGTINVSTVGISGASANSDLVVDGTVVNLDVASSYNGPTFIRNSGTLNANVANALPTANGRTAVTFDGTGTSVLTLGVDQSAASLTSAGAATVTLNANTLTLGAASGSTTFAGIIGGAGGITKDGASTQILSGANLYTGATSITAGTLQVDGSLAAGSTVGVGTAGTLTGSGTINGNATLTGSGIINLTNPGVIGGTLGVTGGNWNGAGSVTGLVTSSSGVFTIGSGANLTANGDLSVTGGTIASGNSASTITGSVSYTSGSSSTFGGVIAGSGKTLTLNNAAATLTLSGTNTYTGATTVTTGNLQVNGSLAAGSTVGVGTAGTLSGSGTINGNATLTGSGIINLTNPGTIAGTLGVTGGNWNGAGSVTGLVTSSSGTFTIGSGANLTANGDLSVTGGTIASGNSSSTITGNVSYTSGSNSTFGGVIAGSGKTLTLNNAAATLTLSGTSTYTGATTVTTGNLQVNGSLAAGSTVGVGTAGTLSGSGTINGNATVTGGGIINLTNPGTIAGTLGVTGGNWNGAGSVTGLVTSSSGVFTIGSGANLTANGGLSVTGGTLASGSGTSTITGSVSYSSASSSNFGGVIAGSGKTLTLNNAAATLTLSGASTYTGATTVSAGTLAAGVASVANVSGAFGNNSAITLANVASATLDITGFNTQIGSITGGGVTGGNVTLGAATLTVGGDNTSPAAYAGVISGTGGLTKIGTGTQTLSGTNTYTGATTITAGTLQVTGSIAAGSTVGVGTAGTLSGSGTVNGNATLTGSGIVNLTNPGTIAGTLGVTGGRWNGAGSVTGLVTSSSGTFTIGNGANLTANGDLSVTGGTIASGNSSSTITGNVSYTSASSSTFGGVIAGSGKTLTLNNAAATLTLSGTSTYTGATTLTNGNLVVNGSIGSSSLLTINGGTLLGTGTVGALQLNSGGMINAGAVLGAGTLSTGSIAITDGQLVFNLGGTGSYDQLNTTGTINLANGGSGAQLVLNSISGYNATLGNSFTLISNDLADAITGAFAKGTFGGTKVVTLSGVDYVEGILGSNYYGKISYNGGTGNDLVVKVVTPEITITESGNDVADGSTYDFGEVDKVVPSVPLTKTFTIKNDGEVDLQNILVHASTGAAAADYIVNTTGTATVLIPGASTTFTITFDPTRIGTRTAAIVIDNNDLNENPFNIALTGIGTIARDISQPWTVLYGGVDAPTTRREGVALAVAIQRDTASDSALAVFATGYTTNAARNKDIYTAKYDPLTGTKLWERIYAGTYGGDDKAAAIAVDSNGDVFITGFTTVADVDTDVYVAKYSGADGSLVWEHTYAASGSTLDEGYSIAAHSSGRVYVAGYGRTALGADMFAAGYSGADGSTLFERLIDGGSNGDDVARSIAVDSSGDVAIAGYVRGTGKDFRVYKLSGANGATAWQWNVNGSSNTDDEAYAVAFDSSGQVAATGTVRGSNYDLYTVKLTAGGVLVWQNQWNSSFNSSDAGYDVVVDSSGNVIVAGTSYRAASILDGYVAKYAAATGALVWDRRFNGSVSNQDVMNSVDLDGLDNVVATGFSYNATPNSDVVTAKMFASDGGLIWQKNYNGAANGWDNGASVAVSPEGNIFVGGYAGAAGGTSDFMVKNYQAVLPTVQTPQVISFSNPGGPRVAGSNLPLSASASSTLPVRFSVVSGPATLNDLNNTLIFSGTGTVTVRASQQGNSQYARATPVDQSFSVIKSSQTISFTLPSSTPYTTSTVVLGGLSTSNLAVTYSVASGPGVINGNILSFSGSGVVTINANQAGDARFNAAAQVQQSINASNTAPVIIPVTVEQGWVQNYAGSGAGEGRAVALQVSGSSSVASFVAGYTTVGGKKDIYLMKYDNLGGAAWGAPVIVNGSGNGDDEAVAAVVDSAGDVYISGYVTVGTSNTDVYVAKFSGVDGSNVWTKTFAGTAAGLDAATGLALDPSSTNVMVGGYTRSSSGTTNDFFAAKLARSNGTAAWTATLNSSGAASDVPNGIAIGSSGDVAMAGAAGNDSWTVLLFGSTGGMKWQRRYDAMTKADAARGVLVDANNDVIITAYSQAANYDIYTAKYSRVDGSIIWASTYNSSFNSSDAPWAAALDSNGNVIVAGTSYSASSTPDSITLKYDGAVGSLLWQQRYNGPASKADEHYAVSVDTNGNPVVTGYSNAADNTSDIYTAKLASNTGAPMWEVRYDGSGGKTDIGRAVAADPTGRVWVAGYQTNASSVKELLQVKYQPVGAPPPPLPAPPPSDESGEVLASAEFAPPPPPESGLTMFINVEQGDLATLSAGYFDAEGNDTVSFSAEMNGNPAGNVVVSPENGTFAWEYDTSTMPAGTHDVTITAMDTGGASASVNLSVNVSSTLADRAWRFQNFGSTVASGTAADDADPDGDGMTNLAEFAFGLNPNASSSRDPGTRAEIDASAGGITAVFRRRKDFNTAGLNYVVQFSSNLGQWVPSTAIPEVVADEGTLERVRLTFPVLPDGSQARFFRIQLQQVIPQIIVP